MVQVAATRGARQALEGLTHGSLPNGAATYWQLCRYIYTPYANTTMVALKIVHSTAPAAARPTVEGGDRCHALPPLDWRDDFRDLVDCELII